MIVEYKIFKFGNKITYKVKYSLKGDYFRVTLDFPFFYLKFSKFKPILLINKFFSSSYIHKGELLQLPDFLFKLEKVVKNNKAYGYLDKHQITQESGKINILKKKKIELNLKKNKVLFDIISKENTTKLFIDRDKFLKIIKFFIKTKLNNISFKLDTPDEILLSLLNCFVDFKSNSNKKTLNNIIIFCHLIVFYKTYYKHGSFYQNFSYDFRGRKYYDCLISTTNFKLTRFFVFYGFYKNNELKELEALSINSQAAKVISPLINHFNGLNGIVHGFYYNENLNANHLFFIKLLGIQFFIGIGVIFKSKILNNPKKSANSYSFKTFDLFTQGVEEFKEFINQKNDYFADKDSEDIFKLEFYFQSLMRGVNLRKKVPIGFDFSCSGHQLRYL